MYSSLHYLHLYMYGGFQCTKTHKKSKTKSKRTRASSQENIHIVNFNTMLLKWNNFLKRIMNRKIICIIIIWIDYKLVTACSFTHVTHIPITFQRYVWLFVQKCSLTLKMSIILRRKNWMIINISSLTNQ